MDPSWVIQQKFHAPSFNNRIRSTNSSALSSVKIPQCPGRKTVEVDFNNRGFSKVVDSYASPKSSKIRHPSLINFSIETYGSGDPPFQETPI